MYRSMSYIYQMDCVEGARQLAEIYGRFADVIITSPPYAEQRKNQYGGIPEKEYPEFTLRWVEQVMEILNPDGSLFINIRPHIKNGVLSDYVLKTRLLLRESGFSESEELIWYKPDSPPLGSINRPRRAWESILWFSKTSKPYCNPKAVGNPSNRIGFENSKFEHGGKSHIHAGQNKAGVGVARGIDVIVAGTSKIEKGYEHSAMFPLEIPDYIIKLCCRPFGMVVDPFMGSGTTMRSAVLNGMGFCGFETIAKHYLEARNSLYEMIKQNELELIYPEFVEGVLADKEG